MDHPNSNMEDIGDKGNLSCGALAQRVSEEKRFVTLPRDCSYETLKTMASFYLLLKSLP